MGPILLLLFIGIPILEIALFIRVGELIGLWPTIATVILTAMAGTALLRHQGLATLAKARTNLDAGTLPVKEIFDGACLLVGGVLLLTPGFVTDIMGLALLMPPIREILRRFLSTRIKTQVHVSGSGMRSDMGGDGGSASGGGAGPRAHASGRPDVIDGDFVDVTPEESATPSNGTPSNGQSPWVQGPKDPPGSGG
ncbi:MAG: FxsA family protein [Rhodospirillum sp.]|nr:FxsA family protein [Rhodospirillum sp.]MCF8491645.1 FxsA family protein [Rhodospirillum sp.]MCF8501351.1 FxsA family protein [Rhodospirillum sp.]